MHTTNELILEIASFFFLLFKSTPVPIQIRVYCDSFDDFYHPYLRDFER
jgi:hypothetical protein